LTPLSERGPRRLHYCRPPSRLQDRSAQIRIRGTFLLLIGLVVVAQLFGLEVILGAFFAGAVLRLLDRDEMMTHTGFHTKLQAVG
jgi:Kef-type K+ transport system membrane component KefB